MLQLLFLLHEKSEYLFKAAESAGNTFNVVHSPLNHPPIIVNITVIGGCLFSSL